MSYKKNMLICQRNLHKLFNTSNFDSSRKKSFSYKNVLYILTSYNDRSTARRRFELERIFAPIKNFQYSKRFRDFSLVLQFTLIIYRPRSLISITYNMNICNTNKWRKIINFLLMMANCISK